MIDSVRRTVLAIANKENFGYIPPIDFNLYAKNAQLELFEDYIYRYNKWVVNQNERLSGSGNADIVKKLQEVIDIFTVTDASLTLSAGSTFNIPSDHYFTLTLDYNSSTVEVEEVNHVKIKYLNQSTLSAPSTTYPAYVKSSAGFTVYPTTITSDVTATYVRVPLDPQWTYQTTTSGEALFDQSSVSYQDFELPTSDEPALVAKICQYAGMSIREIDVVKFSDSQEQKENIQEG